MTKLESRIAVVGAAIVAVLFVALSSPLRHALAAVGDTAGASIVARFSDPAPGSLAAAGSSSFISYSPTALGVSGLTEPGSSTSALSNIIDVRGAVSGILSFSCTQGNVSLNVATYAEDGSTLFATYTPLTAVAASTATQFHLALELSPSSSNGTIAANVSVHFPQRGVAFSFTNASATPGTCTARLYVQY